MNISVNIGSSQDFRLSRALLVYGKSSYEGYPYRHPFVTLHEVMHDGDVARLAEGQLMTPQMLIDVMAGLGRSVPAEILPARVLVRTAEMIVWWSPACERTMFFSDHGNDPDLEKHEWQALSPPALAVQSVRISFVGSRARQRRTANGRNQVVHGAVLELLRQRRVLHREHEDSAGEIGHRH